MTERITKIVPPRNPSLDRQDEIIDQLHAAPNRPLVAVPAALADTIRSIARLQLGGRCTFVQLLDACLTLPEFDLPPAHDSQLDRAITQAIDTETAAEDRGLYRTIPPAISGATDIALMITEAIRQSPDWELIVVPPNKYGSQRLVFQHRSRQQLD